MAGLQREFGVVGLGRIGGGLAWQALGKGMRVVGIDVRGAAPELLEAGLIEIQDFAEFTRQLSPPRSVFVYIPAGPDVDSVLDQLTEILDAGDILIDGGNSYWGDSISRYQRLKDRNINFIDLGTSGGISGARTGAAFMVGGDREAVAQIEPILKELAAAGGYVHAGPAGAGHFVKLVHNGIEFGMLQAIGEGVDLLEHYQADLPVADILEAWRHGTVIRGWLMDLLAEAYRQHNGMEEISAYVEDTGEVNWLVNDAIRMEVPTPVIAQAVMQLFTSRDTRKNWARAIAMMRHGFGGHPYGPNEAVARERRIGRVDDQ